MMESVGTLVMGYKVGHWCNTNDYTEVVSDGPDLQRPSVWPMICAAMHMSGLYGPGATLQEVVDSYKNTMVYGDMSM